MTQQTNILIVDDDVEICSLLQTFLRQHNYHVSIAHHGKEMRRIFEKNIIDLVILDIMLPDEDGFSLCRYLRGQNDVPIIMLTAVNSEVDRVAGLETGADDYLSKPFSPRELLARIKAILRRTQSNVSKPGKHLNQLPPLHFLSWTLDQNKRHLLAADGLIISLSKGEYDLLQVFLEHPQRVLNRDQLLDLTRNREAGPYDRTIDVQVGRLRKKIEVDPKNPVIIKTVRGGGYQFTVEVKQGE